MGRVGSEPPRRPHAWWAWGSGLTPGFAPGACTPSDSLQDVHVLVVLVAPGGELKDTPAGRELREHPLRGQERGAPGGVHDAPVALFAELRAVPPAARVEAGGDLAR